MKTFADFLNGMSVGLLCGGEVDEEFLQRAEIRAAINMKALLYPGPLDIAYITGVAVAENFLIAGRTDYQHLLYFLGHQNPATEDMEGQLRAFFGDKHGIEVAPYIEGWRNNLYPTPWAQNLFLTIKTQPLSGLLCLMHLLEHDIREVRVTGMTFFARDGVVPFARDVHRLGPQREFIRQLAETDSRVVLDDACKAALDLPIEDIDWFRDGGTMTIQVKQP